METDKRPTQILDVFNMDISNSSKIAKIQNIINNSLDHETYLLDFKEKNTLNKKLWDYIASFSYEGEGCILMGVEDDSRKIVGIDRQKFNDEWQKMIRKEQDEIIGCWNWENDLKIKDVVQRHEIPVDGQNNKYLVGLFVTSKDSIIWTGKKTCFRHRNGDATEKVTNMVQLAVKLYEKYGKAETRKKINQTVEALAHLICINYFEFNAHHGYDLNGSRNKHYPMLDFSDLDYFCEKEGEKLNLHLGDMKYTIPLKAVYNFDIASGNNAILKHKVTTKVNQNDSKNQVTEHSEIRDILKKWVRKMTEYYNLKINFDESIIPTEEEILEEFFLELTETTKTNDRYDSVLNRWNMKYLQTLSQKSKIVKFKTKGQNGRNRLISIEYKDCLIKFSGTEMKVTKVAENPNILESLIDELKSKS